MLGQTARGIKNGLWKYSWSGARAAPLDVTDEVSHVRKRCRHTDYVDLAVRRLEKGIFLVSADRTKTNVMAMAWGFIGFQWSKPVFIAPVRTTRFTHGLIEATGEFVVCVQPPSMDDKMMQSGSSSGRDHDKISDLGLKLFTLPEVSVPGIEGSLITYACKVIHKASAEPLSNHTFFFGEILGTYADESLG